MPNSDVARHGSPAISPRVPSPLFLFLVNVYQSVQDVFVHLETRVGHGYNRREGDVGQEGRQHVFLTKTLFYSEPPRAHPIFEPHA